MSYTKKRYITYLLITIFVIGLPFITVNGNHMLLLSFERLQFHFLGFAFNVNELFVMPFLLMLLFIGIFAITTIFGKVWCGWACPQTIFRVIYRDIIEGKLLGLNRLKNKQKNADLTIKKNMIKKVIALILWSILSVIIATNFILYFVPTEDFFIYMQEPTEHIFMISFILSVAGFLIFDILFMKEDFCVYTCPYSRIQTVLYDDDTKQVVYNSNRGGNVWSNGTKIIDNVNQWTTNEECTTCEACVKICPTHIDIRKGLQVECINCLECSDACSTVMGKLGKKSLIEWGSTNSVLNKVKTSIFTKKNNMYFLALFLVSLFAIYFTNSSEMITVNINKTTQLYKIKENNNVTNNYILTLQNNLKFNYAYDVALNDDRFYVKRFSSKTIEAGKKEKFILIISTKKELDLNNLKDTPIKLTVMIYTKETPEIAVKKELVFIYPSKEAFK